MDQPNTNRSDQDRIHDQHAACGLVIFGATGDLTKRKLLPALFDLYREGRLPKQCYILGVARRPLTTEVFRKDMRASIATQSRFGAPSPATWDAFARNLHYLASDATTLAGLHTVREQLQTLDQERGLVGNHLFYLSVAPTLYAPIITNLGTAGLATQPNGPTAPWTRVVIEKPFGYDLTSARQLTQQIHKVFQEEQVFRIDHYLGKETVQNLAVFRFANAIYEPLWNRDHIDHVQITVAEDLGVEGRAHYYDQAGALRDMIQNHLLQLFCLIAMEPPAAFSAEAIHREKLKVLESVRPWTHADVNHNALRGQYDAGTINGESVVGYREEPNVRADSPTESYAALRLFLDNWRWAGVPFYLRTGKRLPRRHSEISLQFREAPLQLFACTALQPCEPNRLTLRIYPNEGIGLHSVVKTPGLEVLGRSVQLDFSYHDGFETQAPSAYETLLLDCLKGDTMLFASDAWIDRAWELLRPILQAWEADIPHNFPNYAAGSWGPADADAFLERDGRHWHMQDNDKDNDKDNG